MPLTLLKSIQTGCPGCLTAGERENNLWVTGGVWNFIMAYHGRKNPDSCHSVCGEATEEEWDGNSWHYRHRESPASLGGCESARHTRFLNAALQAFRKPSFLVLIWPILKYTLNSIFMLKLNVWIVTLPSLCAALCSHLCLHNHATATR